MDPATLAAGAITLLTAYLAKAGAEFAEEGGKAAWRLAGRLLDRLRLAVKGKPREQKALEEFSGDPSGVRVATQEMLQRMFEENAAQWNDIDRILQEVKRLGPDVSNDQRIQEAEKVVGVKARHMSSGALRVNQEIEKGTDITGLEIEDIG